MLLLLLSFLFLFLLLLLFLVLFLLLLFKQSSLAFQALQRYDYFEFNRLEGVSIPPPRQNLVGTSKFKEEFEKFLRKQGLSAFNIFSRSDKMVGNVFLVYGTSSGKTEIVKSALVGDHAGATRKKLFQFSSWMRRMIDFEVNCFVDMRDRNYCPQLFGKF